MHQVHVLLLVVVVVVQPKTKNEKSDQTAHLPLDLWCVCVGGGGEGGEVSLRLPNKELIFGFWCLFVYLWKPTSTLYEDQGVIKVLMLAKLLRGWSQNKNHQNNSAAQANKRRTKDVHISILLRFNEIHVE